MPVLHVVIPCFNEKRTLEQCVRRICAVRWTDDWQARLIIVDDCSSDDSVDIAQQLASEFQDIQVLTQNRNQGKGAAVNAGMALATSNGSDGDLLVIQDADLEYNPNDLPGMIRLFIDDDSLDALVGDRFEAGNKESKLGGMHKRVNRTLTFLSNLFTGLRLEDMECCYKMMRLEVVRSILPELSEGRFGIEPQIVAALSRHKAMTRNHVVEYNPRTFQQGKKIGVKDGFRALLVIVRESIKRAG